MPRPRARILFDRAAPTWLNLAPPLFLFVASFALLWQFDPLHRALSYDPGIFAYISQLVADGFAPHKYAYNEQASLAFLVGGAVMRLGDVGGIPHLISFRLASMLLMASAVVLTYLVGKFFTRSRAIALLAGLIMLGYHGYNMRAATTLEPKSLMLVLGLLTLYFLHKKNWLAAGALAGAAGLAWQIAWGYLIVVLLLAIVQGGTTLSQRVRAVIFALVPALGVIALYALYFVWHNALADMLQQTFLVPELLHSVSKSLDRRLFTFARTFYIGYNTHSIFGLLGLAGLFIWLAVFLQPLKPRALIRRVVHFFLQNRHTAGVLLATFGFALYSFIDFQGYPDWIPLLPFISIFAAWLLWKIVVRLLKFIHAPPAWARVAFATIAVLVLLASSYYALTNIKGEHTRRTWQEQQLAADDLNARFGADAPIWIVGKADLLFFMRRVNLNKYIYLFGRVDGAVDAFEPGGFPHMLKTTLAQRPALIVLARVPNQKFAKPSNGKLIQDLSTSFTVFKPCRALAGGRFLVRPDLAEKLFPKGAEGCLKRTF